MYIRLYIKYSLRVFLYTEDLQGIPDKRDTFRYYNYKPSRKSIKSLSLIDLIWKIFCAL